MVLRTGHSDTVVLAEWAAQVAAIAPDGKYGPAGMKTVKGFLFDGVQSYGRNNAVACGKQLPVTVFPDAAKPGAAFRYMAVMWANVTANHAGQP
jgi:hypothetical protein